MDPLARRRLGRTQVELTQLGFGGAGLGDLFRGHPGSAGRRHARRRLGRRHPLLRHRALVRPWPERAPLRPRALPPAAQGFVLSTKVGRTLHPVHHAESYDRGMWAGGLPFQHRFDYSYDGVMRSFEDSLQRLGLPRIDLLVIHDLDLQHHQTPSASTAC